MSFSIKLKELRIENGINQRELAKICGLSPQCISAFENGTNSPTVPSLLAISKALNVSTDYLLGRTDDLGAVVVPGGAAQLSADEQEILSLYAELSPSRKEDLRIYLRALSGASAISEKKKA